MCLEPGNAQSPHILGAYPLMEELGGQLSSKCQSTDISNTALDNIEALSQTDITSVSFDCGGSVMVSTCSIYCPACGGRITRLNHHGPATNINGRCLCGHGFSL